MVICHRIGPRQNSNFNLFADIMNCEDNEISFDGIYEEIYQYRFELLKLKKRIILFHVGKYSGKDNAFDVGQPHGKFCTWDQVIEMGYMGFEIGYHSWSHLDLRLVPDEDLIKEIKPPFPMNLFAYPYGWFNEKVIEVVKACGYDASFSVMQGDGSKYQQNRRFINW